MKKAGWIAVGGIGIFSAVFYLVTGLLMRRLVGRGRRESNPVEPITFFRPLKTGEPSLERNVKIFLSAVEPDDQVIFAATSAVELRLCAELAAGHPKLDITCIRAGEGIHRNPKISKLAQMEPLAIHNKWVVLDSDAIADRGFLESFRGEWQLKKSTAISAPYFFRPPRGLPSRFDALGTVLALWPGVALLSAAGRLDFLTGACMGVNAPALQRLGGWKALGGSLADDHELGRIISRAGGKVDLSSSALVLEAPNHTAMEWILHQHRAFVTFRLCNPVGSFGLPLTQGVGLSFLFALLNPRSLARWTLHLGLLFLRAESAKSLPGPPCKIRDLWIVSLAEPAFWLLSRMPVPVRWGKRWFRAR